MIRSNKHFLIIPYIISDHVLFIKYLYISKTSLVSAGLKSTEKICTIPLILGFFDIINCKIF